MSDELNEFVIKYSKENKLSKQQSIISMIKEIKDAEEKIDGGNYGNFTY